MAAITHREDTAAFMEKYLLLIEAGETLPLPVLGSSMSPFLVHRRDKVYLRKIDRPLRVGDIVLYRRQNGDYILHRIHGVNHGQYTMVGDAHTLLEPGIEESQILARAIRAERKGKAQGPGAFWWEFFSRVWIRLVPCRPALRKIYGLFRKQQESQWEN